MGTSFALPISDGLNQCVHDFRNWWFAMAVYGISLLTTGMFLYFGWAKDDVIYGVVLIPVINQIFITRKNCSRDAARVSGGLQRIYYGLYRIVLKERSQ